MSRKKATKKKNDAPKPTYHTSKNGRYYKKTVLPSGKCQCRFVSKSEAEAGLGGKKSAKKKEEKPEESN